MAVGTERATPLVSVVMPAFDAAPFVAASVESILAQTLGDFELIVVDDGSRDETAAILAGISDSRMVVLRHETNRGLVAAYNTGLRRARGELVAIQDADDVSLPQRLAEQVRLFDGDPQLVIAGSAYELIDAGGASIGRKAKPTSDTAIRWHGLFLMPFGHPTVMFRTAVARRHGIEYRQSTWPAEDYELASRLLEHGRGANLAESLVRYRIHETQTTAATWDLQNAVADTIALSNLRAIGVEVAPDEMPELRELYLRPPRSLAARELPLGEKLARASAALARQGGVDGVEARTIRRGVLDKLAVGYRGDFRRVIRLAALAARTDPLWLLQALPRRVGRRADLAQPAAEGGVREPRR